jgi:hypothetical protein
LKSCLDKCVSEEQSAFLEGRSITDNALIAIEVIHALKRRTRGAKGELALKIDISKAYDKVDWGFMRGMLERLGFSNQWIHWMMLCVSSVNYSVLVNFDKVGPIFPGRGLRQGDPLSPYLFILVTEGLTTLIKKSVAKGDLHGVQICRGAPVVSHLLFADDCFIFCRSTIAETNHLMSLLKTYEEATGQEINLTKSEVFFSRNLSIAAQEDLSHIMGVRHVLGTGNYLGLPSMIGRKKKEVFSYIKDRVWKRINSWRGRALSRAGKEIMIKSVLQAIPSYVMGVYLLPDSTIKDIERMMNSFWWGGGTNNKGIRWLAWERMTISKDQGGMGFRDLHAFNLAMIAKQGWNIMTRPHTLVAKIYKARYFPNSSFFESNIGHNPSYAWRGIWQARKILMLGCRWSVGNGARIKVMSDPWLRNKDGAWLPSPQNQGVHNLHVNDLLVANTKMWDREKIESLFPLHIVNHILEIPLFDMLEEDKLVWIDSTHGHYSVKSGYKLYLNMTGKSNMESQRVDWSSLWSICAPPKAKHLLWRISKSCLPTRMRLQEKHVPCPLSCPICNQGIEDDWHVLFGCETSVQARQNIGIASTLEARLQQVSNVQQMIHTMCTCESKETSGLFAMLVWVLWDNRNSRVWQDKDDTGRMLGMKAHHMWSEWYTVQQLQPMEPSTEQQQHVTQWQAPPIGWYKCNVDAGFHKEQNKTSTGWCLRDHMGRFVMAETTWRDGYCSITEGESYALLEAMKGIT